MSRSSTPLEKARPVHEHRYEDSASNSSGWTISPTEEFNLSKYILGKIETTIKQLTNYICKNCKHKNEISSIKLKTKDIKKNNNDVITKLKYNEIAYCKKCQTIFDLHVKNKNILNFQSKVSAHQNRNAYINSFWIVK